jgi:ankyrin repeat protein
MTSVSKSKAESFRERANQLIQFAVFDQPARARELLAADPELGRASLYAACATGNDRHALALLKGEPKLARRKGGPCDWPPLLYACFSDLWRSDKKSSPRFLRIVKKLLALGADPNVSYLYEKKYPLTPLYAAAGRLNHPGLTRLLLAAGANPDDNESLYHSAEFRDHACLKLLLKRGARIAGTNAVHRKLDFDDLPGLRLFLDAEADPNLKSHDGVPLLHGAIMRGRSVKFIRLLAACGADLRAKDAHGRTAFQLALGHGQVEVAAFLRARGAGAELTPQEQLLSACAKADLRSARAIIKQHPELAAAIQHAGHSMLPVYAWHGRTASVRVMLKLGFDVTARGQSGETALHGASWMGHLPIVKALLAAGAPVHVKEPTYQADPLGWALHGSRFSRDDRGRPRHPLSHYAAIVKALLAAGAKPSGKVDPELPPVVRRALG